MKTIVIGLVTITLSLVVGLASADDMWSETPDLDQLSSYKPDFVEPATISDRKPTVDMWAETPDFLATGEAFDFLTDKVVIIKGFAASELYSETPDLGAIATTAKEEVVKLNKNLVQR